MPASVVPGLFSQVFDFTTFVQTIAGTIVAIIGGATRGPVAKPSGPYSDEGSLTKDFGAPITTDYGLQCAVRAIRRNARVLYVRAAHGAATATQNVTGTAYGTPAVKAAGAIAFATSTNPADADLVTIWSTEPKATVQNNNLGALGNVTITLGGSGVGGRIAVTGLAGGTASAFAQGTIIFKNSAQPSVGDSVIISDGTTSHTFAFVASGATGTQVNIGATAFATMAALVAAITAAAYNVSATATAVATIFEFDSNGSWGAGHVPVLIGSTAAATLLNFIAAINGVPATNVVATNGTVTVPQVTLTAVTAGTIDNATLFTTGANINVSGMSGGVDYIPGSTSTVAVLEANTPGSWANGLQVQIAPTTIMNAPSGAFDVFVIAIVDAAGDTAVVETFRNLNTNPLSARFVESALANGLKGEVAASRYIRADVLSNNATVNSGTSTLGTGGGVVGADGISGLVDADYIGSSTNRVGLQTLANANTVDFNVVEIPGNTNVNVINAIIALCDARYDCNAILDPPFGLTTQEVADWHNGLSQLVPNPPVTPLNNPGAALYWTWLQVYDSYSGQNIWLPPSGDIAAVYASSDLRQGVQYAPAGWKRGLITNALQTEIEIQQSDLQILQVAPNCINPIIDFSTVGLDVYGESTLYRTPSARQQVHVERLLRFLMKVIAASVNYLVFDPNNANTWAEFVELIKPILSNMVDNNGLEAFQIQCDETTNPAFQRQQGIMAGVVQLVFVNSARTITIAYNIQPTGTTFSVN